MQLETGRARMGQLNRNIFIITYCHSGDCCRQQNWYLPSGMCKHEIPLIYGVYKVVNGSLVNRRVPARPVKTTNQVAIELTASLSNSLIVHPGAWYGIYNILHYALR